MLGVGFLIHKTIGIEKQITKVELALSKLVFHALFFSFILLTFNDHIS